MRRVLLTAGVAAVSLLAAGCASSATGASNSGSSPVVLRLGFLANITHEPALVGLAKGYFTKDLGKNVTLKTSVFSTGTEETTALLAGQLDAAYVGPNPAINAWQKSNGTAIKIISGAASGGASLVVKKGITSAAQLKGKSLATPSLGNTQDVALRFWLKQHGLNTTPTGGGDVSIKPIKPNSAAVLEFAVRPDRRRLGARAVRHRDGARRRDPAGERGQPVARRQLRHHQPGGHPVVPEGPPVHGERPAQGADRRRTPTSTPTAPRRPAWPTPS